MGKFAILIIAGIISIAPVPVASSCKLSFDLFAVIKLSEIVIASNTIAPVPLARISKLSFELFAEILLSAIVTAPSTISPVPFAVSVRSLFVINGVIAASVICY